MKYEPNKQVADLDSADVADNPTLGKLVDSLHKPNEVKGFNDRTGAHRDYVDNDTDCHTDKVGTYISCGDDDKENHSDITHSSGVRESHTDAHDICDNHTDSGPTYRDYSDMCR